MLHDLRKKLCTAKAIGQRQVSPRGHRVVPELFGPLAIVRVLTLCPVDGREKFAPLPPGLDPNLPLYAVPKLSVAVGLPQAVHCAKVLLGDGANLREENPSALCSFTSSGVGAPPIAFALTPLASTGAADPP